jgi:hypothetical protein
MTVNMEFQITGRARPDESGTCGVDAFGRILARAERMAKLRAALQALGIEIEADFPAAPLLPPGIHVRALEEAGDMEAAVLAGILAAIADRAMLASSPVHAAQAYERYVRGVVGGAGEDREAAWWNTVHYRSALSLQLARMQDPAHDRVRLLAAALLEQASTMAAAAALARMLLQFPRCGTGDVTVRGQLETILTSGLNATIATRELFAADV